MRGTMFGWVPRRRAFAEDDLAEGNEYNWNPMSVNVGAHLEAVNQGTPDGHLLSVDAYRDKQIELTDNEHCQ